MPASSSPTCCATPASTASPRRPVWVPPVGTRETNETDDEITLKNSPVTSTTIDFLFSLSRLFNFQDFSTSRTFQPSKTPRTRKGCPPFRVALFSAHPQSIQFGSNLRDYPAVMRAADTIAKLPVLNVSAGRRWVVRDV